MGKAKGLTGKIFGKLTALKPTNKRVNRKVVWICECECGGYKEVASDQLVAGRTQSCGCLIGQTHKRVDGVMIERLTSKKQKNNKSGVKGVCREPRTNKWRAYITVDKKTIDLGTFADKEDAIKARKEAEEKYHKPFLEKRRRNVRKKKCENDSQ